MRRRRSARTGSLSARVLLRIVDHVGACGHDPSALCRSVGLELAALRQRDARVPYALAERLGERAVELTRDPNLGLHLAQNVRQSQHFDAGLLLLAASPSVRSALELTVHYQRYWGDGERSGLLPVRDGLAFRYLQASPGNVTQRHYDECAMAEVVLGLNVLASRSIVPRSVSFRHAAPRDRREHDALFACPLEFSAAHTEALFDDPALDTPLRHANEFYAGIFRQQVEQTIAALPSEREIVHDVRAVVRAALPGGGCTLASTARALALTERTLQRRLEAEDSSFDTLVELERRDLALRYLDQDVQVGEIASLLGYGKSNAFHRAFKRWTGTTPERARAIRRAGH